MTLVDPNAYNPTAVVNATESDDLFLSLGSVSLESKLTKIGGVDFL